MQERQEAQSGVRSEIKPLFITHDEDSIGRIRDGLAQMEMPGKDRIADRVSVGQEYGRFKKLDRVLDLLYSYKMHRQDAEMT
jgi:hypothetical protein